MEELTGNRKEEFEKDFNNIVKSFEKKSENMDKNLMEF